MKKTCEIHKFKSNYEILKAGKNSLELFALLLFQLPLLLTLRKLLVLLELAERLIKTNPEAQ